MDFLIFDAYLYLVDCPKNVLEISISHKYVLFCFVFITNSVRHSHSHSNVHHTNVGVMNCTRKNLSV